MAKDEETSYRSALGVDRIRKIIDGALAGSDVRPLEVGPLGDKPALAVLVERVGGAMMNRSPFGAGLASAQIVVRDTGKYREITFVALATTFGQAFSGARYAKVSGQGMVGGLQSAKRNNPKLPFSRKMVRAAVDALGREDPNLQELH
jgi:hypothetical protein